jgi:hypothetical protein
MKKNTLAASFVMLLLTLIIISTAQISNAQPVSNPAVRAKFVFCASGDVSCTAGNRVRNDTTDEYVNGDDGVSAVFNVGSGSQDLTINLITSSRSVWFDFSNVYKFYNNAGVYVIPSWFATPQNVKPHFNVLKAYNAKLNCATPATGCNYRTAMNTGGWSVDRIEYALQWNPESTFKAVVNEQGPTSYVNVHYQNNGSGDVYTITPIPTETTAQVVSGLAKTVRKTTSNAGQYFMPFTLVVRPK